MDTTNPSVINFGEDREYDCEECGFSPLPKFGLFDQPAHCPECGYDNTQTLDLKAGGVDTGLMPLQDFSMTFLEEEKEVGRYWFDEDEKILKFKGDVDASAQILFNLVIQHFEKWFEEKYGGPT